MTPTPQTNIALVAIEVGPNSQVANRALGPVTSGRIAAAARGDIVAQRALLQNCLDNLDDAAHGGLFAPYIIFEALYHARALASHGNADDILRLACVLIHNAEAMYGPGREEVANNLGAEAISLLEFLADEGSDESAVLLNELAEKLPPYILNHARAISKGATI